jgi:hypothetical protein
MRKRLSLTMAILFPAIVISSSCGREEPDQAGIPGLVTNAVASGVGQADQLREVRDFHKKRREAITLVRSQLAKATNAVLAAAVVDGYLPQLDTLLAFTKRMRAEFPEFDMETDPALAIDNERIRKLENDLTGDFIKARRNWITNAEFGEALERWRRHALRLAPQFLGKE